MESFTKFGSSLFTVISQNQTSSENILISPFSVAVALLMAHIGARGNTAKQIKSALPFTGLTDEEIYNDVGNLYKSAKDDFRGMNITVSVANQLYTANDFMLTEHFQNSMKKYFGATAENVDFGLDETRVKINKWVEEFTHEKIKNLIRKGGLSSSTKLALINAVYFKGNWQNPFDPIDTRVGTFYLGSENKKMDTNMMHLEESFRSRNIEQLDARVLELPYVADEWSMFIILPNKINGLQALESKLTQNYIEDIDQNLHTSKLPITIPKFKVELGLNLKEHLIKMGLSDLFDMSTADLSGISGTKDLYVSDVIHKAFIEVNEEGSEAAAATGLSFVGYSLVPSPRPFPFVADHPFIYLIRHNLSKLVLFVGRLAKPAAI